MPCPADPDKLNWYNYGEKWNTEFVVGANYWNVRSKTRAIKKAGGEKKARNAIAAGLTALGRGRRRRLLLPHRRLNHQ